jgi:hypothetical protein
VCSYELWDRQIQSNIPTLGHLTGSFVRMTRNLIFSLSLIGLKALVFGSCLCFRYKGKVKKEMYFVKPVAWS